MRGRHYLPGASGRNETAQGLEKEENMAMRLGLVLGAVMGLVCLPATAVADWFENFDSYEDGTLLYGIGGWSGWNDDATYAGVVSSAYSRSTPHSIEIEGDTDAVHPFSGVDSGQWTFMGHVYIPSDLTSLTSFIVQNEYTHDPLDPRQWAIEIHFDPETDLVWDIYRDTQRLPMVYDRWTELRMEMDFDADYVEIYYDGQLLDSGLWAIRGGAVAFANLDLYAFLVASPVYWDDLSLVPEPSACMLLALLAGVALRRR
jgi:hypothetical protein